MTANAYGWDEIANVDVMVGHRMRELREQQGLSQQGFVNQLAARGILQWHQTTVGKVESGQRPVRVDEAMAIADTLGVLVQDLIENPNSEAARYRKSVQLSARYWELDTILQFLGGRIDEVKSELDRVRAGGEGDEDGERREAT